LIPTAVAASSLRTDAGSSAASIFIGVKDQPDTWKSADGQLTLTHSGNWKISYSAAASIWGDTFNDGDFGIHLKDKLTEYKDPEISTDPIVGDLKAKDFDPAKDGVQSQTDDLGNVITDRASPTLTATTPSTTARATTSSSPAAAPTTITALRGGDNRIEAGTGNDWIYAGSGADHILGEAGDDFIWAGAGNDSVEGGAGDDNLYGQTGDDLLIGGAGTDIVEGGSGDDQLYGADKTDLSDAISQGDTQDGNGQRGDWVPAVPATTLS